MFVFVLESHPLFSCSFAGRLVAGLVGWWSGSLVEWFVGWLLFLFLRRQSQHTTDLEERERRGQEKRWTVYLERTRKCHRRQEQRSELSVSKAKVIGNISVSRDGHIQAFPSTQIQS